MKQLLAIHVVCMNVYISAMEMLDFINFSLYITLYIRATVGYKYLLHGD